MVQSFEKYGDGEIQLVGKDGVFCERREGSGKEVERENVSAEEVFEGVEKEDDGGNFQEPKREHREGVGDKELNERCHGGREREPEPGLGVDWKMDSSPQGPQNECDDRKCYCGVQEAARKEEAEAVGEMINRLGDQCADLSVANLCGDAPFVFGGRYEGVNNHRGDEVQGHAVAAVRRQRRIALGVRGEHGIPESNGGEQWDDRYEAPQENVPTVDERVLKAETERCGESGGGHVV